MGFQPSVSISSSRSRRTSSASRSRSRSRSASRSRSPSGVRRYSSGHGRRSISPRTASDRRRTRSRSASRSSIASTQVSDHPPSRHVSPAPVLPAANGASHDLETLRTPSPNSSGQAETNGVNGSHLPQRAQSPPRASPIPGFGHNAQDTDVGIQVQTQQRQHAPSPLPQDEPQVQPEMSDIQVEPKTTKPVLPTWDVVPTVPEASAETPAPETKTPALDLAQPPPPAPVPPSSIFTPPSPIFTPAATPPSPPVTLHPHRPQVDYAFEDIPPFVDAKSIHDALRTVVMTRLLRDHQTRDEFVVPVLMENLSLSQPPDVSYTPKTQEQLIEDVSAHRLSYGSDDPFLAAKSWLYARFDRRRTALEEKTERLRLEYQALHQRWRRHCASLNVQAKPVESDNVPVSGRTTRRSAANLGDTVRSDLEMEQIIASLGYDEATDPNQLSTRNLAVIPDMISVTGQTQYTFDDTNHLVENPNEYYAPYTGIHDWTEPEKELFLDKYAAFPKQFGVIAEFLPNKTASQCVDYYYLHKKKLIDFRRVVSQFAPNKRRRRGTGKQKGNGLLSDIRQHDAEVNRDLDDSPSFGGRSTRGRRVTSEARKPSVRRNAFHLEGTTTGTPTPEPEARPKRRRAAVTNRSVLFQEDMDDDTDGEPKKKKRGRKPKSAAIVVEEFVTPLPTPPPTMEMDVDPTLPVRIQWSIEDKALFLDLLAQHGENFKRIAATMPNKTSVQVGEYFKANLLELDLASIAAKAVQGDQPAETAVAVSPSVSAVVLQKPSSASVPTNTPAVNGRPRRRSPAHIRRPRAARLALPPPLWTRMPCGIAWILVLAPGPVPSRQLLSSLKMPIPVLSTLLLLILCPSPFPHPS
ncbi:hypothetical protein B0H17DRAFT_301145 [Mycena rosella]|uniref:SANT domain-containing protein n=1 Tax=Mycena rosella TaxID=1033263 RepID=A0AAD7CVL4_MYCRO|nr:hypothetical protein B0H17DRAFT_301145 [Mycena rosella]